MFRKEEILSSKKTRTKKKQQYVRAESKLSNEDRMQKLQELDKKRLEYKATLSKLAIGDLSKKKTISYDNYTKEKYRSYITNPTANEDKIRDMSHFLYRVSMPYRRLIKYFADIPLFYWNLVPQIDISNPPDSDKVIKNYLKMLKLINNLSLPNEGRKIMSTVFKDGIFYGYKYEDKNACFIHQLDPEYCRIVEIEDGCFNFAFDFSFFKTYPTYLEYMDPSFKRLYTNYQNNSTNYRWQLLEPADTICIKWDPEEVNEVTPPFIGIFEALLDLIDARSLQRNKDEIQNYKLIYQKIPYFDQGTEMDDFKLEMDTAVQFYNALSDAVPDQVGVAMSPMDIDSIDFPANDNENDILAASMKSVFDDSGVSQMLFSTAKSGSVGLDGSIKTDVAFAWNVVENIEKWVKRYILYNTKGSTAYHFEIVRSDIFNKDKAVTNELSLANSGVPNKLKLAAMSGVNPYEMLSNQYFENEVLQIYAKWMPLQTSYTMSGDQISGAEDTSVGAGGTEGINDSTEINKDLGDGKGNDEGTN